MIGLGLLGKVADLAGAVIDSKAVVKKAEAETKMKIATGEISWEQAAIKASDNTRIIEINDMILVVRSCQLIRTVGFYTHQV